MPANTETRKGPTGLASLHRWARSPILAYQLLLLVAFVLVWQLIAWSGLIRPVIARSPLEVGDAFIRLSVTGELWSNLVATLQATAIALVLAGTVGIVIGLSLGLLPTTERVLAPFLDAFNATPRIAIAPVFIIMFGIGITAKVALAFTVVVFMIISASRAGVHAADPDVLRLMTVMGANKRQVFFKVLLPAATPSIFAGLRLGLVYSLLGVVTSELLASRDGLGQLIARYSGTFQLERVYAIVIALIVVAGTLNAVSAMIERRLTAWKTVIKS